jgi:hypothetical protein
MPPAVAETTIERISRSISETAKVTTTSRAKLAAGRVSVSLWLLK